MHSITEFDKITHLQNCFLISFEIRVFRNYGDVII